MIYVLVEDSKGYDDCDRPVFAHANIKVVEKVADKLKRRHERLHSIALQLKQELNSLYEANQMPEAPDLKKLPPRPLVWKEYSWQNAYTLEYMEECDNNRKRVSELSDQIIDQYSRTHSLSDQESKDILSHLEKITYSIDEIEDDSDKI